MIIIEMVAPDHTLYTDNVASVFECDTSLLFHTELENVNKMFFQWRLQRWGFRGWD